MEATSKIICFKTVAPTEQLCTLLGLSDSATLMRLDRVRFGDGEPMAYDQTWLPIFYGQLLEGHDLQEQTIYQILEQEYEIPILSGRYHITAECSSEEIAGYLDVQNVTPLLVIDRLSCTIGQKKVYYQKRYLRPDRISYELFLERPSEENGNRASSIKEFMPVFRKC
ncbi:MAG TPA: UTRA domain-containing protein [Balneolaceae bacterium]|nr:UTRA domain-containing protein [Balneolaceae bacterium]